MPWDAQGNFTLTNSIESGPNIWQQAQQAERFVNAPEMDAAMQDIADGMEHLAARASLIPASRVAGTANAITLTPEPAFTEYVRGDRVAFVAEANNTGAATVNVNALGVKHIRKGAGSTALASGDIVTGAVVELWYDGAVFQIVGGGAASAGPPGPAGPAGPAGAASNPNAVEAWTATGDGQVNISTAWTTVQTAIITPASAASRIILHWTGTASHPAVGHGTHPNRIAARCQVSADSGGTWATVTNGEVDPESGGNSDFTTLAENFLHNPGATTTLRFRMQYRKANSQDSINIGDRRLIAVEVK